jgi:hypothetical protein
VGGGGGGVVGLRELAHLIRTDKLECRLFFLLCCIGTLSQNEQKSLSHLMLSSMSSTSCYDITQLHMPCSMT